MCERCEQAEWERDQAIAREAILAKALGETWRRFDTFCAELEAGSASATGAWADLVEYESEVGAILRDLSIEARALLKKVALAERQKS